MFRPDKSGVARLATGVLALLLCAALAGPATAGAESVNVELTAKRQLIKIAPGVKMKAWTFNGTVPGPVIRAREGDTIQVTLHNADSKMAHSIDLHAAQISPQTGFADVLPGQSRTFSFVARRPGVFMYHCGTSPVLQHIGMGMYGAIVVDPAGGRPPAQETVLVQSEFYGPVKKGRIRPSYGAMLNDEPTFTAFNGRAFRYRDHPIAARSVNCSASTSSPPDRRWAATSTSSATIFDTVEADGNPLNGLSGVSTYGVPAGGGAMFELSFDEPGKYPFVTHSFRWAEAGALGLFEAG